MLFTRRDASHAFDLVFTQHVTITSSRSVIRSSDPPTRCTRTKTSPDSSHFWVFSGKIITVVPTEATCQPPAPQNQENPSYPHNPRVRTTSWNVILHPPSSPRGEPPDLPPVIGFFHRQNAHSPSTMNHRRAPHGRLSGYPRLPTCRKRSHSR